MATTDAMDGHPSACQTHSQGPAKAGAHGPLTKEEIEAAKKELEELKSQTGLVEPVRSFIDDEQYAWRFGGPPDYTLANLAFLKGRTKNHPEGSLELLVENLVKTWEFERSHKLDCNKHKSVVPEKFTICANGNKAYTNVDANEVGNYNVLLDGVRPDLWAPGQSWDDTHHAFKDAFAAFPWEVLKVFSGPPVVAFSWRHWAEFTGKYKDNAGQGDLINMYGFATAQVSADIKLERVDVYYNGEEFLEVMEGKKPPSTLEKGKSIFGSYMAFCGAGDEVCQIAEPLEECPASGKKGKSCPFWCGR
jgi:hypothetical protein